MKHLLLFAGCSMFSLTMTMAQTKDYIKDSTKVTTRQSDGALVTQPQPDLIKLKTSKIPAALRETLQKPKYKGWENSMVYKQKSTNEYILELLENGKAKTYRFNEQGEPIKKDN